MPQKSTAIPRWLLISQILSVIAITVLTIIIVRQKPAQSPYPYIAKRLFVANPNDIIVNFTNLRSSLKDYVKASPEKIGLYFEYLPTGVNINAGANEEFFRASLVKLPVVMRTYGFIQDGKLSLDDKLVIEEKQIDKNYGELWKQGAGTTVTVRELIKFVLLDSDNTAFNVLYERVNVQLLKNAPNDDQAADEIYDYLDIPRAAEGITPMITPKNYTSILKSLYYSAYLNYQNSNDILDTMTTSHTQKWMRSAIRPEIKVADKIGVYDIEPENLHVFSDCGIVYFPERPYSLCVMVHSDNAEKSLVHIQNISHLVFDYIDRKEEKLHINKNVSGKIIDIE